MRYVALNVLRFRSVDLSTDLSENQQLYHSLVQGRRKCYREGNSSQKRIDLIKMKRGLWNQTRIVGSPQ